MRKKKKLFRDTLFALSTKLLSGYGVSREQIDRHVENKFQELSEFTPQYHAFLKLMDYLDNTGHFAYRINTCDREAHLISKDFFLRNIKDREDISDFLEKALFQSVDYVDNIG